MAKNGAIAGRALRVAVNSCLALVNYGCHKEKLFPKQVENDRRLAQEKSERGEKARERLKLAVSVVCFNQEVVLHATEKHEADLEHKRALAAVARKAKPAGAK